MMKEPNLRQLLTSALLAGLVLASGAYAQAQDAKKAEAEQKRMIVLAGDVTIQQFEDGIKWLGVSAIDVPEILKTHMPELKDQGILIKLVIKDSPAEKAGLKVNDILLAFNDTKINKMTDLITAVQNSKSPKGVAEIIRGGKRLEISVLLAKRDVDLDLSLTEIFDVKDLIVPTRMRFFGPGQLVPHTRIIKAEKLPENLSILISRKGNTPATVTVKMDGKHWETTEDKLVDLPVEIRQHVEKNLKKSGAFQLSRVIDSRVIPSDEGYPVTENDIWHISPDGTVIAKLLKSAALSDSINKSPQQITEQRIFQMKKLLEQQRPDHPVKTNQQQSDQQFQQLKKLIEQLQKDVGELKKQTRAPQKKQPRTAIEFTPTTEGTN